ncbi:MAG: PA0069 family radical SAM protein [Planctomycetota bacterium]|nr:MAG: PA0069 family radical SAM protein [Planctomycetota bacterium]
MTEPRKIRSVGRGAQIQTQNRFTRIACEDDWEQIGNDEEYLADRRRIRTEYFVDTARTIVSTNDSPDIPFRYSLNPYRGCQHGCVYCYARPTHEFLDLSGGLDFETRIFVKPDAPDLLRDFLTAPDWSADVIVFSGVTDCYQPCERQFRLTRGCLEVAAEARQPISIITKNPLVRRDVDVLRELAAHHAVEVRISLTTLDQDLARHMEPRTGTPRARLDTITALRDAGIPVGVMIAPVIPGLNDSEIPALLRAAAEAGAQSANYTLLRLPACVEPIFLDWLDRELPDARSRIESRIRGCRNGRLSDSRFGRRMRGSGPLAEQIRRTFAIFRRRYALADRLPPLSADAFRPPRTRHGQRFLF